jgi:PPOX class probable F420-dependent enzyme
MTITNQLEFPQSHADLLSGPMTAVITTVGADGMPQSTAVWFLLDEGVVKASISTDRQKYRNLRRHPNATLLVFDPTNPYRTLEVRATVALEPDPDRVLLPKFAEKYSVPLEVLAEADTAGSERVVIVFSATRVVAAGRAAVGGNACPATRTPGGRPKPPARRPTTQ